MKFRVRFTGELKFTEVPEGDQATVIGQSRQVKQTEILDLSDALVDTFRESVKRHVAAGLLVPVDAESKEQFPKTKKK